MRTFMHRGAGFSLLRAALVTVVVGVGAACSTSSGPDLSGAPRDAAVGPDAACVPDRGPGCCYPTCQPDESLTCLGDNICGYPCRCDKRTDGGARPDLACVPNQGPGCCYPTCAPGQTLSCIGANICGYPCTCVPSKDGGAGTDGGTLLWYSTCGDVVCRGHQPSTLPPCTTEKVGAACPKEGLACDPGSACNNHIVCAASDPKMHGCPISSQRWKSDIRYLDAQELRARYEELRQMKLATYRYTQAGPQAPRHLGFILEDQPQSASVDRERDMVDLYGFTSLAVAAVQVQAQELAELKRQIAELQQQLRAEQARRRAR